MDRLQAKGVALRILNMNLNSNDATGKLMLHIIGSVAEFERQILLERQREGIAAAQRAGKYKGQQPVARNKSPQIFDLIDSGKTRAEVAKELGIGLRSVFRILADRKKTVNLPAFSVPLS